MGQHRDTLGPAMGADAYEGTENYVDRVVETAVLNAMIPNPMQRRAFLQSVGAATALAAIAQMFPLGTAKAIAQEAGKPEKTKLNIGYVPITCTVPLLLAHAMGEYGKEGLESVNLSRTPGWAIVRDKLAATEFDATHLVLAMPLTMTMGVGGPAMRTYVSSVQNVNGNAITLHVKHKDRRDPIAARLAHHGDDLLRLRLEVGRRDDIRQLKLHHAEDHALVRLVQSTESVHGVLHRISVAAACVRVRGSKIKCAESQKSDRLKCNLLRAYDRCG